MSHLIAPGGLTEMTIRGALLTRFYYQDYTLYFDLSLYKKVIAFLKKTGLINAIDDTKNGLLLFQDDVDIGDQNLYITGIPSNRKDKFNTPIRYNMVFSGSVAEIRSLVEIFLWLFRNNGLLQEFAAGLDSLIPDNTPPIRENFDEILDTLVMVKQKARDITPFIGGNEFSFFLYSQLAKDNVSLVEEVLKPNSPDGVLWYDGNIKKIKAKKKILQKNRVLIAGIAFFVVMGLLLLTLSKKQLHMVKDLNSIKEIISQNVTEKDKNQSDSMEMILINNPSQQLMKQPQKQTKIRSIQKIKSINSKNDTTKDNAN